MPPAAALKTTRRGSARSSHALPVVLPNTLYYGDNLDVLRRYVADESVDLVYLDPPFNSNQNYNVLFREQDGTRAASQIKAFGDTWHWDQAAVATYHEVVEEDGPVGTALEAMHTLLGGNEMMAYLTMMAPRLKELHRVLKPTGSLYLHCDPTASHYLKLLLDAVFGPGMFRSEIVWRRSNVHNKTTRQYGPIHDTIFFYTKGRDFFFEPGCRPYLNGYIEGWFTGEDEKGPYRTNMLTGPGTRQGHSGKPWRGFDPTSVKRHWAIPKSIRGELPDEASGWTTQELLEFLYERGYIYIPRDGAGQPKYIQRIGKGVPYQDIWAYQPYTSGALRGTDECIDEDVKWLEHDREALGYPTQKPEGLLARILRTSAKPGQTVLDPFCGCGTTVAAAQSMGYRWIGIDITHLAITLLKHRLRDAYGPAVAGKYTVVGEPVSMPDALKLAEQDRFQFQWWALGLAGARPTPAEQKKGRDKGIDGRLSFFDDQSDKAKHVIFSVKSGVLKAADVRDLRGVIEREHAAIGVLISIDEPTSLMRAEAAEAGCYVSPFQGLKVPRLQLRTVGELLDGKRVDMPPHLGVADFIKRAPRVKSPTAHQRDMFDPADESDD